MTYEERLKIDNAWSLQANTSNSINNVSVIGRNLIKNKTGKPNMYHSEQKIIKNFISMFKIVIL